MARAQDFSYRAKGLARVLVCSQVLLTGLGAAATIKSKLLSDITLQFRYLSD
jgi:hypothetical protein